jgi:hypothetical protein
MELTTSTSSLLDEIARPLDQARISAAPCPWLGAISVFVDERYENYDYDLIPPSTRLPS